jgi:hypothetical protein
VVRSLAPPASPGLHLLGPHPERAARPPARRSPVPPRRDPPRPRGGSTQAPQSRRTVGRVARRKRESGPRLDVAHSREPDPVHRLGKLRADDDNGDAGGPVPRRDRGGELRVGRSLAERGLGEGGERQAGVADPIRFAGQLAAGQSSAARRGRPHPPARAGGRQTARLARRVPAAVGRRERPQARGLGVPAPPPRLLFCRFRAGWHLRRRRRAGRMEPPADEGRRPAPDRPRGRQARRGVRRGGEAAADGGRATMDERGRPRTGLQRRRLGVPLAAGRGPVGDDPERRARAGDPGVPRTRAAGPRPAGSRGAGRRLRPGPGDRAAAARPRPGTVAGRLTRACAGRPGGPVVPRR